MAQIIDFTKHPRRPDIRYILSNGWNIFVWNQVLLEEKELKLRYENNLNTTPHTLNNRWQFVDEHGAAPATTARQTPTEIDEVSGFQMKIEESTSIKEVMDSSPCKRNSDNLFTADEAREIADRLAEDIYDYSTPAEPDSIFQKLFMNQLPKEKDPSFTWRAIPNEEIKKVPNVPFDQLAEEDKEHLTDSLFGIGSADIGMEIPAGEQSGSSSAGSDTGSSSGSGCPQHKAQDQSQQKNKWRKSYKSGVRTEPLKPEELCWDKED